MSLDFMKIFISFNVLAFDNFIRYFCHYDHSCIQIEDVHTFLETFANQIDSLEIIMSFFQRPQERRRGELRIIGAISIDLNGVSEEAISRDLEHRSTRVKVVQTILKEFCSNSTVHGVRYFTEAKRHWIERIWWTIMFSLSLAMCITGIISIWDKWHRRPVIVSFNDKTTAVGLIPFPAITICSTQKFITDKIDVDRMNEVLGEVESNASALSGLSSDEINRLDAIMHVCLKEFVLLEDKAIPRTESIYTTMQTIGPDQSSILPFATWLGQITHFKPTLTGEGFCYTFNSLNSRDIYTEEVAPELLSEFDHPNSSNWSMENGYTQNVDESELYPFRVFGCGSRDALFMILNILLDDSDNSHQFCSMLAQGFHLSIHSPDELPRLPDEFIHIPAEQDIYVSVKPHLITTSRGLRRYSPNLRGCYFKTGRQLRFFRLYSQQHCELECLANFTRNACGCVKFAMPRDRDTKVCTMADIECYINAELEFKRSQQVRDCTCLPDCTAISYDVEMSQAQTRYSVDELELRSTMNDSGSGFEATSKLFISFKENHFIALNRTESYTISDFIASCGGFLGLFMGISVLSVIELIYFFTLRLCCKFRKRKPFRPKATTWAKQTKLTIAKNELPNRIH